MLIVNSFNAWLDQRASSKGAALAFYTLFSMAPTILLVIAIAGAVFGREAAQGAIFGQLKGLVGAEGAAAIEAMIASARHKDEGTIATIVAGVLLLVGATTVFSEVKDSLDEIWNTPPAAGSGILNFLRTRLLSFGLLGVLAFLLMVSLAVSAAVTAIAKLWGGMALLAVPISALFSFAVTTCLFAAVYKILPQVKLSYKDVWTGAFGTALLFIVGKYLIGAYLGNSDVISSYGAAGSLIAVILWVYYSGQIFYFGAEFTHQYATTFGSRIDRPDATTGSPTEPGKPRKNQFLS
ncbi:MAG TPA: YihY/virulence factor BrkB family protein [Burkholderiaceae bacterium]